MARVRVSIRDLMLWLVGADFIWEEVLATAIILVKLDDTIFFQSPFPTSPSHHIISRMASDIIPGILFHPTPDTENDEHHRNDSDRFSSQHVFISYKIEYEQEAS